MQRSANHNMVVLARESRGLTQKQLSEKLQVSQGYLSKIEQSLKPIPEDLVYKLSNELDYPNSFFFEPAHIFPPISPFHRKRKSLPKKQQCKIEAEANIRRIQISKLLKSVEMENSKVLYIDIEEEQTTPQEIAQKIRYYWGIPRGPIENITELMEDSGIIIVPCRFGSNQMDGFSFNHKPPLIYNNADMPGDRQRFTLAHELGHIVMHQIPTDVMEKEADQFAAEFLMPEKEIRSHLKKLDLRKLADLKRYWKVSMAAILHRASSLGVLTPNQTKYLWIQMGRFGYRRKEPFPIKHEKPSLVDEIVKVHLTDLGYTVKELSEVLLCKENDFQNFFQQRTLRLVK